MSLSESNDLEINKGVNPVSHGCVTLADLGPGETGIVEAIDVDVSLRRRLNALGVVKGTEIAVGHVAPMGDPRVYRLLGYQLSLRNEDARKIVLKVEDGR